MRIFLFWLFIVKIKILNLFIFSNFIFLEIPDSNLQSDSNLESEFNLQFDSNLQSEFILQFDSNLQSEFILQFVSNLQF